MSSLRVYSLVGSPKFILVVFYTAKNAYQFRVVTDDGEILSDLTNNMRPKNAVSTKSNCCPHPNWVN